MRATWLSPRAIGLHVTLGVVLPLFGWAAWWQLHRALGGNTLSWAYTFEWPFFGLYAVLTWWRLVHDVAADRARLLPPAPTGRDAGEPRRTNERPTGASPGEGAAPAGPPELRAAPEGARGAEDRELDAYNAYLASLAETDVRDRR